MVEQYALDRLLRSPADMSVVLQAVQSGDFGVIMRPYEDSIRTPIQGLLFGAFKKDLPSSPLLARPAHPGPTDRSQATSPAWR